MKLASVETILEKEIHPNADLLEIVKIQGWRSVVRKSENYQVGDKVVFIPIDTVVQPAPWNAFLQKTVDSTKPIRVDTVRLRGVFSQGLCQPLSILPPGQYELGQEVHELIGVSKYEREIPAQLAGLAKGNFPYHIISKTDEENLLSTPELLEELRGHECYVTTKWDGCLDGDVQIKTEDGVKSIKHICETKYSGKVASFDIEMQKEVFSKITNHSIQDEADNWFEIELEDGKTIKLTGNHRVWLPELNCYRTVDNLKESDILFVEM